MKIKLLLIVILTAKLISTSFSGFAQDGYLDSTFNYDGMVVTDFYSRCYAKAIATQADGKIVCIGENYNDSSYVTSIMIVRYLDNGDLDSTFGNYGKALRNLDSLSFSIKDGIIQSDGKILFAGKASISNDAQFLLGRFNTDGSIDSTFGIDGIVLNNLSNGYEIVNAIVQQDDGKIVIVGTTVNAGFGAFVVARYNINGNIDSTFNSTAVSLLQPGNLGNNIIDVALQNDGKIVTVGEFGGFYSPSGVSYYGMAIIRHNADGSLDSTLNNIGYVNNIPVGYTQTPYTNAIQDDGKILVGGFINTNNNLDLFVYRYNADGSFDNTFDGDGRYIGNLTNGGYLEVNALAIQNDGKIIAVGRGAPNILTPTYDLLLLRLNSNGTIDSTFENDGIVWTDYNAQNDFVRATAIQNDNKIVITGDVKHDANGYEQIAIVRYTCDVLTELEENQSPNDDYTFYPNPFAEKINIKSTIDIPSEVVVYDVSSRILVKQKFYGSTNIDMNSFDAGLYIYAIMQENELVQKGKLIKN